MTSLWTDYGGPVRGGAIGLLSGERPPHAVAPLRIAPADMIEEFDVAVVDPPSWLSLGDATANPFESQEVDEVAAPQLADVHRHVRALDGIRGLAILLVLCHHLLPERNAVSLVLKFTAAMSHVGRFGVDLFFVLSGFLITGILLDAKGTRNYYRRFYARRSLRIMPLYYGVLLAVAVATLIASLFHPPFRVLLHEQKWLWLYATNVVLSVRDAWSFQGEWLQLSHFWSLAVEEHFYLVWPAVVLAFNRKRLMACCLALIIAAPILRAICMLHFQNYIAAYTLTPCRVDTLALGALLAAVARGKHGLAGAVNLAVPLLVLAISGMVGVLLYTGGFKSGHPLVPTVGYSCIAILSAAGLLWVLSAPLGGRLERFWTQPLLLTLGKYSYGLYVFHYLLQPLFLKLWPPTVLTAYVGYTASVLTASAFAMTASLVIAMASYHFVEAPFLKLKRHFA